MTQTKKNKSQGSAQQNQPKDPHKDYQAHKPSNVQESQYSEGDWKSESADASDANSEDCACSTEQGSTRTKQTKTNVPSKGQKRM